MKKSLIAFATATAVLASSFANAASVELTKEIQAASIHEDGVDMVVYYTHAGDAFEVVATYVENGDATTPYRMRMAMTDGDSVTFALPGRPNLNYTFARAGQTVSVNTSPTNRKMRLAQSAE